MGRAWRRCCWSARRILASLRSPGLRPCAAARAAAERLGRAAGAAERRQQVACAFQVEQYYFDVAEVEAWLGEQELLMMSEDKGQGAPRLAVRGGQGRGVGEVTVRWSPGSAAATSSRAPCPQDEQSTLQLLKKHLQLEQGVENYEEASRSCRASAGRCWRWAPGQVGGASSWEWSSRIWSFAVGNWGRARTGRWGGRGWVPLGPRTGALGLQQVVGVPTLGAVQGCLNGWGQEH